LGGGSFNTISSYHNTIGGGCLNTTCGNLNTISGGYCNATNDNASFIGGGTNNSALGVYATVSGGYCNTVTTSGGIVGGSCNVVTHDNTFIVGNGITSSCPNTTYVNCLSIVNLQDGSIGLPSGSVYYCSTDSNRIYYVP
jgi:hypothetical protein